MTEFAKYPFEAERFDAVLPPLVEGVEADPAPVVIIGGGPVGLTLALGLARQGVRSTVIEADDSVCFGSRAICISRRSLEILDRFGAVDGFLDKGLAWTGGRSFFRDREVLRFQMPHDAFQKLPPMVNIEQFYIEHFLMEAARRQPDLIEIRWQSRMTALEQEGDKVRLTIETPVGAYASETGYVVACDGGRSTARELLGAELKGTSYEGRYVIADIAARIDLPTERLAWFDPPSNPGLSILMHKQPDDVWRIDYQIGPDEDPDEAVKPENVLPRVRRHLEMIGYRGDWKPIWIAIYKAHALTLEDYRRGRVFFSGDAAHLVPIFGVRGANSGIDDADNLAWKLAYAVSGKGGEGLLDSYSAERVFAAHKNLSYGTKSAEFMAPPNAMFVLMREAVLTLAAQRPQVASLINPRQTSVIRYEESPLNGADAGFAAGPGIGEALAERPVDVGGKSWLTDLIGPDFTLIVFGKPGFTASHPLVRTVAIPSGPATADLFAAYGARAGSAYLVRPDGHVAARWADVTDTAVSEAIERIRQ